LEIEDRGVVCEPNPGNTIENQLPDICTEHVVGVEHEVDIYNPCPPPAGSGGGVGGGGQGGTGNDNNNDPPRCWNNCPCHVTEQNLLVESIDLKHKNKIFGYWINDDTYSLYLNLWHPKCGKGEFNIGHTYNKLNFRGDVWSETNEVWGTPSFVDFKYNEDYAHPLDKNKTRTVSKKLYASGTVNLVTDLPTWSLEVGFSIPQTPISVAVPFTYDQNTKIRSNWVLNDYKVSSTF
jgi:hypothetical protein